MSSWRPLEQIDRSLRLVLDASPGGLLVEAHDRIAYVNDAYAHLLGYRTARELAGATIQDIAHPADVEQLNFFGRCREEGKPAPERYEFRAMRKGGEVVVFDAVVWTTRTASSILIATAVRQRICELATRPPPGERDPGLKRLSARESEVFTLLLAGKRAKQIAFELNLSEKTVGTLRSRVYTKLALRSDLDLFRFAARHGLLDLDHALS